MPLETQPIVSIEERIAEVEILTAAEMAAELLSAMALLEANGYTVSR